MEPKVFHFLQPTVPTSSTDIEANFTTVSLARSHAAKVSHARKRAKSHYVGWSEDIEAGSSEETADKLPGSGETTSERNGANAYKSSLPQEGNIFRDSPEYLPG